MTQNADREDGSSGHAARTNVASTPQTKEAFMRAHSAAQRAANAVQCASSWMGEIDPEEDDRNPTQMLAQQLDEAELEATTALAAIQRIREMTKSQRNART